MVASVVRVLRFERMTVADQLAWAKLAAALPAADEDVVDVTAEPISLTGRSLDSAVRPF
jgi:hypothetical protein